MDNVIERSGAAVELSEAGEMGHANESLFCFVAYHSSYLLWSTVGVLGSMIVFMS